MADVREEVQKKAKEAWLNSHRMNSIIASVGAGKSKVALEIIRETDPLQILLLTNATNLRDVNWKAEFEKFNLLSYWNKTTSETYQAMYSRDWSNYHLIILDEIDFACSPEYGKCLEKALQHGGMVLGLTGFITKEKRDVLNNYLPICYEISTEEMQEADLLNKSEFIFVEFPLSKARTIEKKLKAGGTFKQSENGEYEFWDKKYQKALIIKSTIEKKYKLLGIDTQDLPEWKSADWNFKFSAAKRKAVLHNLTSSVGVVGEILSKILVNPTNKVLIFSANTKQCDKFPNVLHGKKQQVTLDDLNEGRVRIVSIVKKITRGTNLVGVNYLIRESFDGSEEIFNQSHGRLLRLRPDQVARYIVLVPYFETMIKVGGKFVKGIKPTQASSWVESMTRSFNIKNPRYIKLGEDYKIKDGIEI